MSRSADGFTRPQHERRVIVTNVMAAVRRLVRCVVLFGLVAGAVGRSADDPVLHASEPPGLVVNLHFTSSDRLSASSRGALMAETESIWTPGHVRIKWLRESTEADEGITLRVLVVARPVARSEYAPWTVAELQRPQGSAAVAIASTIGARRIVDESRWQPLLERPAVYDQRLGVVLGRAVAHEIGHYLLQTNTHARRGLMRARIDAREFADLRSGSFRLDKAAEAYLATFATRGVVSLETMTGFSYAAP
jgi:hypothetical protein